MEDPSGCLFPILEKSVEDALPSRGIEVKQPRRQRIALYWHNPDPRLRRQITALIIAAHNSIHP